MKKKTFNINGHVVDINTQKGIAGLRVEAWDRDLLIDDLLGTAVTDADGRFTISFDETYYREICFDRKPDVYFKVYKEQELIHSTKDSILWNVAYPDIRISIPVGLASPIPTVPEDYSFYLENNWFTRKKIKLEDLTEQEHEHIAKLLNRHLRSEISKIIGEGNPGLNKLFDSINIDYREVKDSDLYTVIKEKLLAKVNKCDNLEKEIENIEKALNSTEPVSINDLLNLGAPLKENPVVAKDFRKAKTLEFAKIIRLDDSLALKLAEKDLDLDFANEADLNRLMKENILDEQQKKGLLLTIDLSRLSGENIGLIKALKNDRLQSMEDFVLWDKPHWTKVIGDNKITLPEGEESIESYAENLRLNIEKTFPTQYLLKRVIKEKYDTEINFLNSMESLLGQNETLIDDTVVNAQMLNWAGIGESDKQKIEKDLGQLLTLANTYRSMGLAEIVNNKNLNIDQKKTVIGQRLANLDTFYKNNSNLDLHQADFFDKKSNLDWTGIEENNRPLVKKQMMAFQRTLTLANDFDASRKLLDKGFDSASAIADVSENDFLKRSGLALEIGRTIYQKSQENTIATAHFYEAIRDAHNGLFKHIAVSNQGDLVNDLLQIDGYEALFGSQDYCDCEHCKSILGPAAYFVDLMHFVHINVSQKAFLPDKIKHPLYLKNRRPDLWKLKLTCQNTTTEIPYLEVVNDVLKQYIENQLHITDVYDMLRKSVLAITLPFNLPLEELRLYLNHFGLKLYDIYKILDESPTKQLREKLGISDLELAIIITPNTVRAKNIFGDISPSGFDVQDFIRLARINRDQLDDLLDIRFLPEVAQVNVGINIDPSDIQQYKEVLKNLTDARLDLIYRFIRFWKKTGWTIREFDLVLCALKSANLLNNLEEKDGSGNPKILQVSQLVIIREALNLSIEEMCVMIDDLPGLPIEDNRKSFRERVFDLGKILGGVIPTDKTKDKITPLLLAGLGITESDLDALFALFQIDTTKDLAVDIKLLSKLFRHARIAKGLKLSIENLINAIHLCFKDTEVSQVSRLIHINDLMEFITWQKLSPFSIPELIMILKGLESSSLKYKNDANSVAAAVLEIQKSFETAMQPLINTYLQKTYNLTNEQLNKLKSYTLEDIVSFLQINGIISADDDLDSLTTAVQGIEASIKPGKIELLKSYLQRTFNLTSAQLEDEFLAKLVSIGIDGDEISTALNAKFTDDAPDNITDFTGLVTLLREIERLMLLFGNLKFEAEMITYFINNPGVFGISDLKNLTLDGIKNAVFYKSLVETNKEMESKIQDTLKNYQPHGNFTADDDIKIFSDLWQQPSSQVQSLWDSLKPFPTGLPAVSAVQFLWGALQLSQKLGIEGYSLIKLTEVGYEKLKTARDIAVGAFASRYDDEKIRLEKLEPYKDKINTVKRDALCNYIIARRGRFKFNDCGDLYKFFLLDVEMSGCFRTSKLVAAISSVQLYVHRCLINLEQSDKELNPSIDDISVDPTWIPIEEWEWRKNYRVWEANRKVFLYPENYIDPTLRDNKTAIFKELEDELLQEKITQESAEAAYKKYLSQFSELTKLRYAGAYYHSVPGDFFFTGFLANLDKPQNKTYFLTPTAFFNIESQESVYYLFARTNEQPYQYYYRTYNHYKNGWGNWEKLELSIEAEEISALIHRGKLYIYWTEVKCKEINKIKGGESTGKGAVFKVYVKYSSRDERGKWSAPQRLYIGHTHFEEDKIYKRIIKYYPNNEDVRDKKHDYVFEQFESKVFRKPYARIASDVKAPIKLSTIWAQDRGFQVVKYLTKSFTHEFKFDIGLLFSEPFYFFLPIPSIEFIVTHNQFNLKQDIDLSLGNIKYVGTFYLTGPKDCALDLSVTFFGKTQTETIPVDVEEQTVPSDIYASIFSLSLSKNQILNVSDADIQDTDFYITDSAVSFLKAEYNVSYAENGNFCHYVEDGTEDFTEKKRVITQYQAGYGRLSIPQITGSGQLDNVPLTTILTDDLNDILFSKGLEQFLSLQTQQMTDSYGQKFKLEGSYGQYYWEMFFHIPFLIANHLNANQKFKEAKWWYERIFNPTSPEKPSNQKPSDHNWQFRGFRNLDILKLKDILVDAAAIEAYKKDPFNPHAIARLRLNAYQKAIVMKYIDNLIDWGDHLFAQDTRESINEAEMLYQLAADILGKRPVKMGKCQTAGDTDLTYEKIGPRIGKDNGSEFLITLENYYWNIKNQYIFDVKPVETSKNLAALLGNAGLAEKTNSLAVVEKAAAITRMSDYAALSPQENKETLSTAATLPAKPPMAYQLNRYTDIVQLKKRDENRYTVWTDALQYKDLLVVKGAQRFFGPQMVKQYKMAFCVPQNEDLLGYWDRVDDRLFKIRNCMNISGVRRSLALFQPPIDPMMLVRARASGLSLEDISSMLASLGQIPPYRFNYLVEKARQFTQTVQGFGNSLLSALEKKDVEELTLLRSVHERNILKMTGAIKQKQLEEAQQQVTVLEETLTNVQNRIDYYQGLVDDGLTGWEVTQQVSKHNATGLEIAASFQKLLGAIFYLIPQLGSPFALKYGGLELGNSAHAIGEMLQSSAAICNSISASAGLEATFQRREQEWKQQLTLAKQEYKQVEKQKAAAEIRSEIAEKDLEIHEKNIEHADELYDFYKDKFTNLGLYNYLSSTLNRLYREAYNQAYNLAKMAERAYSFEQDDSTIYIANDNWQFDRAGLLAGERLTLQLQQMETSYLDKNKREYELTKHVSLALLDPLALVRLRATGVCDFEIPEALYDMDHAGHYFRRIKSVSISLPCIAGPYTSVSAKLSLVNNRYRKNSTQADPYEETPGNDDRFVYNVGAIQSIAASNSQNDSGVFELNFRDERYLPFEGTGAISSWGLELPTAVRQFDYNTISDVVLHIKYTAREGGSTLKGKAESPLKNRLAEIKQQLNQTGLHIAINMKHDFPNEWHQFKNSGTISLTLDKSRLPYMAQTMNAAIADVVFIARVNGNPTTFSINVDGDTTNLSWITEWALYRGNSTKIDMDTPFELSVPANLENLEELMLVVKCRF